MKRLFAFLFCFSISLFSLNLISPRAHAFDSYGWCWPVPDSYAMSQGYSGSGDSDHRGIDIISNRGVNETVVAAREGTVVAVYDGCTQWCGRTKDHSACHPVAHLVTGDIEGLRHYQNDGGTYVCNYGFGKGVVIDHGNGVFTEYAHMSSVSVDVKQKVHFGEEIGKMGAYGNASGLHLHFEIKQDAYMNGAYPRGTAVNSNPQGSEYSFTYDGTWINNRNIWYSRDYYQAFGSDMGSFGYDRTIADGNYLITNAASPADALYYLDIAGSDIPAASSTNVTLCGPLTGSLITNPPAYEIWNVKYENDRYYTITQYGTNGSISLDVTGASVVSGANIMVHTSNNGSNQKWAIFLCDGGSYSICSKVSGWALTAGVVNSNSNITQQPPQNTNTQRWNFIPYSPVTYTVSYNGNGSNVSSVPGNQTKDQYVPLTLSDIRPTRPGYTFQGWATSASATSAVYQPGGTYTANSAVTLYAVWKLNTYTVTYNKNTSDTVYNMPSNQTKVHGTALTLGSNIPTRTGFTFQGWATSPNAASVSYQPGDSYSTDSELTLFAVWNGSITEDWIVSDKLPANINSAICDIEYRNTYQTTAQSSPGADWSQVSGSGNTTYVNDGGVYDSDFDLGETSTRKYVGSYYYHYCSASAPEDWVEHYQTGPYTDYHVAGSSSSFDQVESHPDDTDSRYTYYRLKWNTGPWAGGWATCEGGHSALWYLRYQYQNLKAVTNYTWIKTSDWTSTKDSTATSVQYRYRLKSSLTKLSMPAYLTTIEDEAFAGAVMNAVIVPDSCTSIGSRAFANCSELLFVSVPQGTTIASDAFEGCGSVTVNER